MTNYYLIMCKHDWKRLEGSGQNWRNKCIIYHVYEPETAFVIFFSLKSITSPLSLGFYLLRPHPPVSLRTSASIYLRCTTFIHLTYGISQFAPFFLSSSIIFYSIIPFLSFYTFSLDI